MRAAAILPPMLFQGKPLSREFLYNPANRCIIQLFHASAPGASAPDGKRRQENIIFYDGYPEQERTRIGDDFPG